MVLLGKSKEVKSLWGGGAGEERIVIVLFVESFWRLDYKKGLGINITLSGEQMSTKILIRTFGLRRQPVSIKPRTPLVMGIPRFCLEKQRRTTSVYNWVFKPVECLFDRLGVSGVSRARWNS